MRSLRFMQDNLVKTITDELKALRNVVEEVQLVVKQSTVSDACVVYLQTLILIHSLLHPKNAPRMVPGFPLSAFSPSLSIHFLIFCSLLLFPFYFLIHFTYFLLLSIRSLSTRIVSLHF